DGRRRVLVEQGKDRVARPGADVQDAGVPGPQGKPALLGPEAALPVLGVLVPLRVRAGVLQELLLDVRLDELVVVLGREDAGPLRPGPAEIDEGDGRVQLHAASADSDRLPRTDACRPVSGRGVLYTPGPRPCTGRNVRRPACRAGGTG